MSIEKQYIYPPVPVPPPIPHTAEPNTNVQTGSATNQWIARLEKNYIMSIDIK